MTISRSKLLVLAVLAVLSGASLFAMRAAAQDAAPGTAPSAEALEAAKAYLAIVPAEEEVNAGLEDMLSRVDVSQRVLARSLAEKSIDMNKLKADAAVATAQIFTVDEIKAMTAFFGSEEGKAIRSKMQVYNDAMQNVMTQALQPFAVKMQENKIMVRQ